MELIAEETLSTSQRISKIREDAQRIKEKIIETQKSVQNSKRKGNQIKVLTQELRISMYQLDLKKLVLKEKYLKLLDK